MDYIREIINVGDDLLYTVTSAIERNDYRGLSADLKERLRIFEEDVRDDIRVRTGREIPDRTVYPGGTARGGAGNGRRGAPRVTREVPQDRETFAPGKEHYQDYRTEGIYRAPFHRQPERTPFRPRIFGKGKAIAKFVCGIIGMVCFIPATMGTLALTLVDNTTGMIALLTLLPFSAASIWLTVTGNRQRKLVDTYNHYAEIIGPSEYISMEDLATYAGTSEEEAQRQIEKMMKNNMLPQGRFDRNQTTLMLTPRVWKQYQAAEQSRLQRELSENSDTGPEPEAVKSDEENSVLREGSEFVEKVRHYNDLIPDEAMSEKLFRLEAIIQRIFTQLEKEPDSAPDLHRLMNYYLPTVDKLLQAYTELENHPSGMDNIDRTRKEIEEAVDTVNVAFENLFDDLFQDTAWDISSDISVMKTMMKQDGLMEKTPS